MGLKAISDTRSPSYLVDSVISISFLGSVFTVLPTFAAAHNPDWFAILPVLCLCSNFVIDGNITVESQGAMKAYQLHLLFNVALGKDKISLYSKGRTVASYRFM